MAPDNGIDLPGSMDVTAPIMTPAPLPTVYAAGASNGVAMNEPPAEIAVSIADSIKKACSIIEPEKSTALVARVDLKGANLLIARRFASGWTVDTYIGRTWAGDTQAGFEVMKSW